jgi:hypothetical protein
MSTRQSLTKATQMNVKEGKSSSVSLTPRQWNMVSQRLINFSTQLSKTKRELARPQNAKAAKG